MRFSGVLKFSSVFVTSENKNELINKGFGARSFATSSPSRATELLLGDEEAFFLVVNSLLSLTLSEEVVSMEVLWNVLLEKNTQFPSKYKVYSFLREQSFVVKPGLHYGIDFAVYRSTPLLCHSEICVTVVDGVSSGRTISVAGGTEDNVCSSLHSTRSNLNWRHVSTLTRVLPDVKKIALLCYVEPLEEEPAKEREVHKQKCRPNHPGQEEVEESKTATTSPYLLSLFDNIRPDPDNTHFAPSSSAKHIDFSSSQCLTKMKVHPVTVMVRRQTAQSDLYQTVGTVLDKYRSMSMLKIARKVCVASGVSGPAVSGGTAATVKKAKKKKRKAKGDHSELRAKTTTSKANVLWKVLQEDPAAVSASVVPKKPRYTEEDIQRLREEARLRRELKERTQQTVV